ncbi:MAG: hypothetical protein ABID54_04380 [Pseudomonadota bacterium]
MGAGPIYGTHVSAAFTALVTVEELANPMSVKRPPLLFDAQFFEYLEIPGRPSWIRIVRYNSGTLQLLAIIHILHRYVLCIINIHHIRYRTTTNDHKPF